MSVFPSEAALEKRHDSFICPLIHSLILPFAYLFNRRALMSKYVISTKDTGTKNNQEPVFMELPFLWSCYSGKTRALDSEISEWRSWSLLHT